MKGFADNSNLSLRQPVFEPLSARLNNFVAGKLYFRWNPVYERQSSNA